MKRPADRQNPKQEADPHVRSAASTSPCTVRTYNVPRVRFSATVEDEPEMQFTCVMVTIRTENALRFSSRLDNSAPEVRFEPAIAGH